MFSALNSNIIKIHSQNISPHNCRMEAAIPNLNTSNRFIFALLSLPFSVLYKACNVTKIESILLFINLHHGQVDILIE